MKRDVEVIFASKFLSNSGRSRFCRELKGRKRRQYLNTVLPHGLSFNDRYAVTIPLKDQDSEKIHDLLMKYKAPETCYIISSAPLFDGKEMSLKNALNTVVGKLLGGTVIICIPDKLVYFEGENYGDRRIFFDPHA